MPGSERRVDSWLSCSEPLRALLAWVGEADMVSGPGKGPLRAMPDWVGGLRVGTVLMVPGTDRRGAERCCCSCVAARSGDAERKVVLWAGVVTR